MNSIEKVLRGIQSNYTKAAQSISSMQNECGSTKISMESKIESIAKDVKLKSNSMKLEDLKANVVLKSQVEDLEKQLNELSGKCDLIKKIN